jgi:hypothetical protein
LLDQGIRNALFQNGIEWIIDSLFAWLLFRIDLILLQHEPKEVCVMGDDEVMGQL